MRKDISEVPPLSVVDRYHIVTPADLQAVARKRAGITAGITNEKGSRLLTVTP